MTLMRSVLNERDRGFSLVELVVAMFVIAVILILLVGVQISALTSTADARRLQQATAFANQAMEQMRAIPWAILNRGMSSNFATFGDPHIVGGNLVIDGKTAPLHVGNPPQNLSQPWVPLFDSTGSHIQTRQDASLAGTEFVIKSYVLAGGLEGTHPDSLGLAVVVEWDTHRGTTAHTTLWSTASRGEGCGDPSTRPFLAACQAMFESSSTTGTVVMSMTARSVIDEDNPVATTYPLLGPGYGDFYSLIVRTASAAAVIESQQVTTATSVLQYGGSTIDDHPSNTGTQPAVLGWTNGYRFYDHLASNDVAPNAPPLNPANLVVAPGNSDELERTLTASGSPLDTLRGRSDVRRPGTAISTMAGNCQTGIPTGQPCARAHLGNFANINEGSGYVIADVEGVILRLSRRLSESASNVEYAWAARFLSSAGTDASVGCGTISGPGCVSAGADRVMGALSIGTVVTGSGNWNGQASEGLVTVQGRPGVNFCPAGFTESVMVQRGEAQPAAAAVSNRCGQIRYWNGSGYTNWNIATNTSGVIDVPAVTWSHSNHTIVATAQVTVQAPTSSVEGSDPNCRDEACTITARSGGIIIAVTYTVTRSSQPQVEYVIEATTVVNPPEAFASYKEAPVG